MNRSIGRVKWKSTLTIPALALALCVAATATGQEQLLPLGDSDSSSGVGDRATPRFGVATYQGQELDYEVVDGWAIHGGDMVLGAVEDVRSANQRRRPKEMPASAWPQRRDIAPVSSEYLWPDGVIPYVIEPGFNERGLVNIRKAIEEWNSRTVITLVERTTELDFVRFRPEGWTCRASVGRIGGEQSIWLRGPDGCNLGSTVHEIGHAVGLWHEHQRMDRDAYVFVGDFEAYGPIGSAYEANVEGGSPYDYASIMHYTVIADSIPPGIRIGGSGVDGLSLGDIDGVARLYGKPPKVTTISTNPPGLEIIVDSKPVTTPATFNWNPGSEHVLEASSPQTVGDNRFLFGRWSDGGSRRHAVTAGAGNTWIEANYIVQQRLVACADPPEAGDVRIRPESRDDYFTIRTPFEIEATPSPRATYAFMNWHASGVPAVRADRQSGRSSPGRSSNPTFGLASQAFPTGGEYLARFTAVPLFFIDSNVDGIAIRANNGSKYLPWAFPAEEFPEGISLEVPAMFPEDTDRGPDVRHRFDGWSDGGERARSIAVPASGGSVSLSFTREYRLRIRAKGRRETDLAVSISPASEDGFYAAGTQVQITALPDAAKHFAGWTGEVSGHEPVQTVVMDAPKSVEAVFTASKPLSPEEETDVVLAARTSYGVYGQSAGWHVLVPPDASELSIRFQSSSADEVDLYLRRGQELYWRASDDGQAPRIWADFASTVPGANEMITLRRDTVPRLTNGVYYIGLGVPPTTRQIRGTLSVGIRRSGIVKASPPAFTFVASGGSDPTQQIVRLTHETAGPARYRIEASQPWLSAYPNEWVQMESGVKEIALAVNGAGLSSGNHEGKVAVVQVGGQDAGSGDTPTGIEIPVALVTLPDSASVSRRVNRARVSSRPRDGDTYGAGETVEVSVDVVDQVRGTGKPTLTVGIGNRTRQAEWDGVHHSGPCGEGAERLTFRYLVQTDDEDADGISVAENALALNDGSITTILGAPAVLALAPIANDSEHKIDGSKATAPEVGGAWIRSRPWDGTSYGAGEEIWGQVGFNLDVEITGSPTLALTVGTDVRVTPLTWGGDRQLWFRYRVEPGDIDADGISIPAGALALNGGSIRSAAGAAAVLGLGEHAIINSPGHKVDGSKLTALEVSGVWIRSRPQDGTSYGAGEEIWGQVGFNQDVEITGSPTLALTVGASVRMIRLTSAGDNYLWFRYRVEPGDTDADGISIPLGALAHNLGSIRSAAGAAAVLGLGEHAIINSPEHKVDGSGLTRPEVSGVWIRSRPQDGTSYGAGEEIWGQVGFNQDVEITGSPTLALTVGARVRTMPLTSAGDQYLWFRYRVKPGDTDADGISIPFGALAHNLGSIRSAAGAAAVLGLGEHAIINSPEHKVDGSKLTLPEVSGVWIRSRPQDGTSYGAGEEIWGQVGFSQYVEMTGSPTLALAVGASVRVIPLTWGGDHHLWFSYRVEPGDMDADGISIPVGALALNGGSIRSAAGTDAVLGLGEHAIVNDPTHKVDGGG